MANSSDVSSTLPSRDYHCKVCDLNLDTFDSLEVHLQYHKENLYVKWGTHRSQNNSEINNGATVKTEATVTAPADSSDTMMTKPNPEFQQRATPETSTQFPHPGTPQSYHSAPSPYQNHDPNNYSPGSQFGNNYTHSNFAQNQQTEQVNWEQSQYSQEQQFHKPARYHPYNVQERAPQVSSSSSLYGQSLNQPTPSPSPNQCDKCGFVSESAAQLSEHCNTAHGSGGSTPTSSSLPFQQFPGKQFNNSAYANDIVKVKEEHEESADILDLDSHKVVYQGNEGEQPNPSYEKLTQPGRDLDKRSVPIMPWEGSMLHNNPQINGNGSIYNDQKPFQEQKIMIHSNQKFPFAQDKYLPEHQVQKPSPYTLVDQKSYSGVPMHSMSDYQGLSSSNADIKPPYRPYESPTVPQITSTQPSNPTSSTLPSIDSKGANWKSNEARRPKTYNCTACNKWFTSSGHLKRHYNTTLHKNAVRASGQPDPATAPISAHHHPSREPQPPRPQPRSVNSNTQSPAPSEDSRSVDDGPLQSPYTMQNFDQPQRVATMQPNSPYSHLHQGNLDNNFSNNPLANHPLQHQINSHPLNIGSPPAGIGNSSNGNHQASQGVAISLTGNHPNGEAGPSVSQNHQMRGLLSVPTSNISTPSLIHTQQSTPALTALTLPPFSQLGVNPYTPTSVMDPMHTPLYLGQNFQQNIVTSYPNGLAPHVLDMAINNPPIASPVTLGESTPEEVEVVEQETLREPAGSLPSFAQLQTQNFSVYVSNYIQPNVGGQVIGDDSTAGYIIVDQVQSPTPYNIVQINQDGMDYEYSYSPPANKDNIEEYSPEIVRVNPYNYSVSEPIGGTIMRDNDLLHSDPSQIPILKMEMNENMMDYGNKENYVALMRSPASPESAKADSESGGSPAVTSTVSTPLVQRNQGKKPAATVLHKCYECDKIFNKACYLTQHNKTFHSGARPFKCDRCGKRFADDVSYEQHYQKHTDNKPFKCSECPKSFNHKPDLRRHMCLHSGSKPFACDHCGKGFIRKDHMVKHYEIHLKKNASRVRNSKAE